MLGAILNTRGVVRPRPPGRPCSTTSWCIAVARGLRADARRDQPRPGAHGRAAAAAARASAPRSASSCRRWCCCRRCAGPASAAALGLDLRGSRPAGGAGAVGDRLRAVSQPGYLVQLRSPTACRPRPVTVYTNAAALQMPYGVLGVSLLTALMPRMSRARRRRRPAPACSPTSRSAAGCRRVALLPVAALFTVLGPPIGTALFGRGRANVDGAARIGVGARGAPRSGCCRSRSPCCSCASSTR